MAQKGDGSSFLYEIDKIGIQWTGAVDAIDVTQQQATVDQDNGKKTREEKTANEKGDVPLVIAIILVLQFWLNWLLVLVGTGKKFRLWFKEDVQDEVSSPIIPKCLIKQVNSTRLKWSVSQDPTGKFVSILGEEKLILCWKGEKTKTSYAKIDEIPLPLVDRTGSRYRLQTWSYDGVIWCGCFRDCALLFRIHPLVGVSFPFAILIYDQHLPLADGVAGACIRSSSKSSSPSGRELILLSYTGYLSRFAIPVLPTAPAKDGKLLPVSSTVCEVISLRHAGFITSFSYSQDNEIIAIGGAALESTGKGTVSVWKIEDTKPYIRPVFKNWENNGVSNRLKTWLQFPFSNSWNFISHIAISSSANSLIVLDSGAKSVHVDLSVFKETFYSVPPDTVSLQWFNNDHIYYLVKDGSLCIRKLSEMRTLQDKHNTLSFSPFTVTSIAIEEFFFILERKLIEQESRIEFSTAVDAGATIPSETLEKEHDIFQNLSAVLESAEQTKNAQLQHMTNVYTLSRFSSTTPEKLFALKIERGLFDEALKLAGEYDLPKDLVFKKQFESLASPYTAATVLSIFSQIEDSQYVLRQLFNVISSVKDTLEIFELLEYGRIRAMSSDAPFANENAVIGVGEFEQALQQLEFYQRVAEPARIWNFTVFRKLSNEEICVALASLEQWDALHLVLSRSPNMKTSTILEAIRVVPLVVRLEKYEFLLQEVQKGLSNESSSATNYSSLREKAVLTIETRSMHIDKQTGLISLSHDLLSYAVGSLKFFELETLLVTVVSYQEFLYSSYCVDVGLEKFSSMSPQDLLAKVLGDVSVNSIVEDVRLRCSWLASGDPDQRILCSYLARHVPIECGAQIIYASRPSPENPEESRIIKDEDLLLRTALDMVYHCDRTDVWGCMNTIFESLPLLNEERAKRDTEYAVVQAEVDQFERDLSACELLFSLKVPISISTIASIRALSKGNELVEGEQLLKHILQASMERGDAHSWSKDQWSSIYSGVCKLISNVYKKEHHKILLHKWNEWFIDLALNQDNFELALEYLERVKKTTIDLSSAEGSKNLLQSRDAVTLKVAEAAYQRENFGIAAQVLDSLIKSNYAPAWSLALSLASDASSNTNLSANKRLSFITFATRYCDHKDLDFLMGLHDQLEDELDVEKSYQLSTPDVATSITFNKLIVDLLQKPQCFDDDVLTERLDAISFDEQKYPIDKLTAYVCALAEQLLADQEKSNAVVERRRKLLQSSPEEVIEAAQNQSLEKPKEASSEKLWCLRKMREGYISLYHRNETVQWKGNQFPLLPSNPEQVIQFCSDCLDIAYSANDHIEVHDMLEIWLNNLHADQSVLGTVRTHCNRLILLHLLESGDPHNIKLALKLRKESLVNQNSKWTVTEEDESEIASTLECCCSCYGLDREKRKMLILAYLKWGMLSPNKKCRESTLALLLSKTTGSHELELTASGRRIETSAWEWDKDLVSDTLSMGQLQYCMTSSSANSYMYALAQFCEMNSLWRQNKVALRSVSYPKNGIWTQSLPFVISQLVIMQMFEASSAILMQVLKVPIRLRTLKFGIVLTKEFLKSHSEKLSSIESRVSPPPTITGLDALEVSLLDCQNNCTTAYNIVKKLL